MTRKKRVGLILLACFLVLAVCGGVWIYEGNTSLRVTRYELDLLPGEQNFTIAQVSDVHFDRLSPGSQAIIEALKQTHPDCIAVTGDLLDSRSSPVSVAAAFLSQAQTVAPVYYVAGNHEARVLDLLEELEEQASGTGVAFHNGVQSVPLADGVQLELVCLDDPSYLRVSDSSLSNEAVLHKTLDQLVAQQGKGETCRVLFTHRPEYLSIYAEYDTDLVLTGHAHGGQVRVPGLGGLYAPGQGFLPKYTWGLYQENATKMIVSRGIGNSLFPVRVNDPPELVIVHLT